MSFQTDKLQKAIYRLLVAIDATGFQELQPAEEGVDDKEIEVALRILSIVRAHYPLLKKLT